MYSNESYRNCAILVELLFEKYGGARALAPCHVRDYSACGRKIPAATKARVVELSRSGMYPKQIAIETELNPNSVTKILREHGIFLKLERNSTPDRQALQAAAREYLAIDSPKFGTISDLAKKHGVSRDRLRQLLYEMRSRGFVVHPIKRTARNTYATEVA